MLPQGLAATLIDSGMLLGDQAETLLAMARQEEIPFVTLLLRQGYTDSQRLAAIIADSFGYPLLDLDAIDIRACPCDLLDHNFWQKHRVLPMQFTSPGPDNGCLYVAFADPVSLQMLDDIRLHTGRQVNAVVADGIKLWQALDHLMAKNRAEDDHGNAVLREISAADTLQAETTALASTVAASADVNPDDAPLVRFVDNVLRDAIYAQASDIHIEPFEEFVRIRSRIDGSLHEVSRPPASLAPRIISRIKVMADMDISERRLPQDGRLRLTEAKNDLRSIKSGKRQYIDFRISSMPTLWGEKVVMRLLESASTRKNLDDLDYEPAQQSMYRVALQKAQGLILVTGPTGSGKTVSLYAGLGLLNTMERNISTVEDPVEINIDGVNQVAVNKRTGLDFAAALRAFMRQDPDVIMVGEIRDQETADIAVKAAQTGHLVLSTLHTNSAAESITRLLNMGVPAYNLCGSLSLIIAQRLVRRLCSSCKVPASDGEARLRAAGMPAEQAVNHQVSLPVGCNSCHQGYRGRVCVAEVLPMSAELNRLIINGHSASEIESSARALGHLSLRESALARVARGDISLADADRLDL
ncbi:MAG: ATPase, T2SS/T4P/T4SS family [Pseudohongiella sp.]|uniref:GspE/PulE family protein n=1 Tax=Pseudohongiella sp. TaxID=1979412 RepID=UPI0034A04132